MFQNIWRTYMWLTLSWMISSKQMKFRLDKESELEVQYKNMYR